jgi:hypothetical protein
LFRHLRRLSDVAKQQQGKREVQRELNHCFARSLGTGVSSLCPVLLWLRMTACNSVQLQNSDEDRIYKGSDKPETAPDSAN